MAQVRVAGPIIGVIGSNKADERTAAMAEDVGRRIAQSGALLLCGGLGGVMEAACKGAAQAGGLTVGILPGDDPRAGCACSTRPPAKRIRAILLANESACFIIMED